MGASLSLAPGQPLRQKWRRPVVVHSEQVAFLHARYDGTMKVQITIARSMRAIGWVALALATNGYSDAFHDARALQFALWGLLLGAINAAVAAVMGKGLVWEFASLGIGLAMGLLMPFLIVP
jgi:hypothetical protein